VRLAPRDTLAARHARLRQAVVAADLDGLVVSHLPNVFYLTNFLGTAGIAVAMRDRLS
jgi:Xaa-Pro aminopeptidase